jgi:hypothetical protein
MVAIFAGSASTGYAMLPGESAIIVQTMWQVHGLEEKSKYEQYYATLMQVKNQLSEFMQYRNVFNSAVVGNWKDPLRVMRDEKSRVIALGTDLRNSGWQVGSASPGMNNSPVIRRAALAVEKIDRIIRDGERPDAASLHDSLEDLYEVSNATRAGGRSEAAMKDMAETVTFMGQVNQHLKEQYDIIDECYQMAQQGGLSQEEVQRLTVISQTAQARAQGLQLQAQMQSTKLQMSQLGLQIAAANTRDRENLDERANRVGALNAIKFAPGVGSVGDVARSLNR